MLRITNTDTPTEQRWILSGQLVGPWAAELWSTWDRTRGSSPEKSKLVDLTDVTFIDEGGEKVLRAIKSEGGQFVARGVDTKYLVAGLEKRGKCPLRRCISYLVDEGGKERKDR
jgi:hypothetical protein